MNTKRPVKANWSAFSEEEMKALFNSSPDLEQMLIDGLIEEMLLDKTIREITHREEIKKAVKEILK